jgi:hypothetical protein
VDAIGFSLIILLMIIFAAMLYLAKPWRPPGTKLLRWARSLVVGFSTASIVLIVLMLWGLLRHELYDVNNISENVPDLSVLLCIFVPVFIITTVGQYLSFIQLSWLYNIKDKSGSKGT